MARSKSSHRWLQEHEDDEYVKKARQQGYRSRAVYKLIELDQKFELLKPGLSVVELGAAPGGWTQFLAQKLARTGGETGRIIASDILPMDGFEGVTFIQGDFTEADALDAIRDKLGGNKANLVLSDMAPNLSGVVSSDQARSMYLAELALELAREVLAPGGHFVSKLFQGEGFDTFVGELRQTFRNVNVHKPAASRPRSREVYVVARNLFL